MLSVFIALLGNGEWSEWKIHESLLSWGMVDEKGVFCMRAELLVILSVLWITSLPNQGGKKSC